jgi:hypothetical protein
MDCLHHRTPHHFGAALGVTNVQPEKGLNDAMKHPACELAPSGLRLMQDGSGHPARTNDAISLVVKPNEFVKGSRSGGTIGINVADQIRQRRQLESFDQRAPLANRRGKLQPAHLLKLHRDALKNTYRVVRATVQHDAKLEVAVIILPKIFGVLAQHRLNPLFFVVRRNQQQQAGTRLGHGRLNYQNSHPLPTAEYRTGSKMLGPGTTDPDRLDFTDAHKFPPPSPAKNA